MDEIKIEGIERLYDIKLLESQKQLLNKCLEARKDDGKVYICMPCKIGYSHVSNFFMPVLRAIFMGGVER